MKIAFWPIFMLAGVATSAQAECEYSRDDLKDLVGSVNAKVEIGIAKSIASNGQTAHLHAVINKMDRPLSIDWRGMQDDVQVMLKYGHTAIGAGEIECEELRGKDGLYTTTEPSRIKINAGKMARTEVQRWVLTNSEQSLEAGEEASIWRWSFKLGSRIGELDFKTSFSPSDMGSELQRAHGISIKAEGTNGTAAVSFDLQGSASGIAVSAEGYGALLDHVDEVGGQGAEISLVSIGPEETDADYKTPDVETVGKYVLISLSNGSASIASVPLSQTDDPYFFFANGQIVASAPSWLDELVEGQR